MKRLGKRRNVLLNSKNGVLPQQGLTQDFFYDYKQKKDDMENKYNIFHKHLPFPFKKGERRSSLGLVSFVWPSTRLLVN
jgi:hypothetical protein